MPPLDLAKARQVWPDLVKKVGAALGWRLSQVEPVDIVGSDVLVIAAKQGYNSVADACGTPDALLKIEQSLERLVHRHVTVKYEHALQAPGAGRDTRPPEARRGDALSSDPMVQKVIELFEARSIQLEFEDQDSSGQP
jgi:DNA polymerase-3 subunit gamma/tau